MPSQPDRRGECFQSLVHKIILAFVFCAATAVVTAPSRVARASPLSDEQVSDVIHDHLDVLRGCYEKELGRDPSIRGRLVVAFTIAPSVSVTAVGVSPGATLTDANVVACTLHAFWEMRFPEFTGPPVNVTFPLVFGG